MSDKLVDDSDLNVTYSGSWRKRDFTLEPCHATQEGDDTATLKFTGIGVEVYAVAQNSQSFAIDGGNPTVLNYTSFTSGLQSLFSSPPLSNGQHTLTVTNLYTNPNDDNIVLGYFLVKRPSNTPTLLSPLVSSGSSATSSTSTTSTPSSSVVSTTTTSTLVSSTSTSLVNRGTSLLPSSPGTTTSTSTSTSTTPTPTPVSSSSSSWSTTVIIVSVESSSDAQPASASTSIADSGTVRNNFQQKAAIIGAAVTLAAFSIFIISCLWLQRRRKRPEDKSDPWPLEISYDVPTPMKHAISPPVLPPQPPSSPSNRYTTEPPPYDALGAGHPTSVPVDSPQHRVSTKRSLRKTPP